MTANCPTCNSHLPNLHPAVQHGGELSPCSHLWHLSTDAGKRTVARLKGIHDYGKGRIAYPWEVKAS